MSKTEVDEQFNTSPEETQATVEAKIIKKGKKTIEKRFQTLKQLKIEYVPVGSIHPNEYNPNRQSEHDFELLVSSMQEDGFTQPIVCQQDGTIVDGEHRWRAAQAIGMSEIPVVFVNMTAEQMRISTLRHNRARGSEDVELSAQLLADLQELGALDWAQDSLLMSDDEINKLLEDIPAPEALAAEEFSTAWEPDQLGATEDSGEVSSHITRVGDGDAHIESAASTKAVADIREREKKLKEAKTSEEREMVRKESDVYRLSLMFSGDEATLIKSVLGSEPANKIIEMCKREQNGE
ncbi:hypothetical protein B6U67_04495 [Methanosarcinales archaeon ex4484_138]|nr:MAG: hypothetical protein B6U67_04495 [Methanosarcinales archaeon ex4484_138]